MSTISSYLISKSSEVSQEELDKFSLYSSIIYIQVHASPYPSWFTLS